MDMPVKSPLTGMTPSLRLIKCVKKKKKILKSTKSSLYFALDLATPTTPRILRARRE